MDVVGLSLTQVPGAATPHPLRAAQSIGLSMSWILGLAGGDVKSAGGICQDVPKLPEIGCLSLVPSLVPA